MASHTVFIVLEPPTYKLRHKYATVISCRLLFIADKFADIPRLSIDYFLSVSLLFFASVYLFGIIAKSSHKNESISNKTITIFVQLFGHVANITSNLIIAIVFLGAPLGFRFG